MVRLLKLLIALIISVWLTVYLQDTLIIRVITQIIGVVIWLGILGSDQEFYFKTTWLIIILINPYAGLILYIAFGFDYRSKQVYTRKIKGEERFLKYKNQITEENYANKWERILINLGERQIYQNNKLTLLENGEKKFEKLKEKIKAAEIYIHLEYYIIRDSKIWDEIVLLLSDAVERGVKVRVICDGVGSLQLTKKNFNYYRKLGIEIYKFSDVKNPAYNDKLNLRNHRKIAIIDGKYGFVGGINIADEYIGISEKYGTWHDTHLMIQGEVIRELALTFAKDWYYETKDDILTNQEDVYFNFPNQGGNDNVQILASGPDNKEFSIKDVYFKLIAEAKDEVVIMTPYLVPDYELLRSMITAAKNKVKIKVIVPGKPDKLVVGIINRSYYDDLLNAGIEIYEVKQTFVHSKVMIVDNELAVIGTTNLDFRSFNLNFEITAFTNSKDVISDLQKIAKKDYNNSRKIDYEEWQNRSIFTHLIRKAIQLFAPFF